MFPPGARGGAAVGHLVLDGVPTLLTHGQLPTADVLPGPTGKVVGLSHVRNGAAAVTHPVLPRLGRRIDFRTGGGVVLVGTAGLVDEYDITSFFM